MWPPFFVAPTVWGGYMRRGRYYLGRVIKLGALNKEKLLDAIAGAATIPVGKSLWTITNVIDRRQEDIPYIYAKLAKFSHDGHVTVVDTSTKSEVEALTPNLLIASTPFVYLPEHSGIAYMHLWNVIENEVFTRRFKGIIEATYDNFFVHCSIEPVADYRAFGQKLRGLQRVRELAAKVHPPNPLFGRLWASLDRYVKNRNASEVAVRETQDEGAGLATDLPNLVESILKDPKYEPDGAVAIGDAAMLMAADGYGTGRVVGDQDGEEVVIRTSDTQKSLLFAKEPESEALAKEADKLFRRVTKERDMKHL
jgi:hypothetical protein